MNKQVKQKYQDFRKMGVGGFVGYDAKICLSLARCEYVAERCGIEVEWEPDDSMSIDDIYDEENLPKNFWDKEHYIECAFINDTNGDYGASLGGIVDAGADYRRLISAELISEVMPLNTLGLKVMTH